MARYRWIKGRGMVSVDDFEVIMSRVERWRARSLTFPAPMIMESRHYGYESIVTGERIDDRRAHREHLKRHGMEEVGSERPKWMRERDEMRAEGIKTEDLPDPADAAHARAAEGMIDVSIPED